MINKKAVHLLGYGSSIAGPGPGCGDGPLFLQQSKCFADLAKSGIDLHWQLMTMPSKNDPSKLASVLRQCTLVADHVADLVKNEKFFIVMGGRPFLCYWDLEWGTASDATRRVTRVYLD